MNKLWVLLAVAMLASAGSVRAQGVHDDIDRNGRGDIVFRGGTSLAYWSMGSFSAETPEVVSSHYAGDGGPGYEVVAINDFDGDDSADVLWTNGSSLKLWINDGSGKYTPVQVGNYGGGWQPFAAGDVNGDNKSDILFRGSTHLAYWLMDGARVISSSYAGNGGEGYRVVAAANFCSTPVPTLDVLWTNGSDLKLWGNPGDGNFSPHPVGNYGGGWEPFAAGDINADGIADILFRGGSAVAYWLMDTCEAYSSGYFGDAGPGFRAIAVSDYDADGYADILWTNGSRLKIWQYVAYWDYGDWSPSGYIPVDIRSYGGGWEPLEQIIPAY